MSNIWKMLNEHEMMRNDGTFTTVVDVQEALGGKVVAFYFANAANSTEATPHLKAFYENSANEPFEVVYCSTDSSAEEMEANLAAQHGHWCYMKFGDPMIHELMEQYEVSNELATLIVVNQQREVVDKDALTKVQENFENPATTLHEWEKACGLACKGEGEHPMACKDESEPEIVQP